VQAAQALQEAARTARRAAEAKSRFLATVSHEFRAPLNAILGFSEMIDQQILGPSATEGCREYAKNIHTSGDRMLSLVNDILDLSTVEAGRRRFQIEELALRPLFDACILEVDAPEAAGAPISVFLSACPQHVFADRQALHQMIVNLLANARKFTDPGEGKIELSAKLDDRGQLAIEVADTGIGMSAAILDKIGEPFIQSNDNPEMTEDGSGLGLSIVKTMVEAMGGRMDIFSLEGQGTRVSLILPNVPPEGGS